MDVDNSHTDNPDEWLTPEALSDRLEDVAFYFIYSKSHMKDKQESVTLKDGSKVEKITTARPRFHVYFALSETFYQAKDAARFFFGVEQRQGACVGGSLCVDEFIAISSIEPPKKPKPDKATTFTETSDAKAKIPVVERHWALLQIAIDVLSMYGEDKAHKLFDLAAERCDSPKPFDEVKRICDWALSKHNELKSKFTKNKTTLTLGIIGRTLQELNISVQFDVISKNLMVRQG